jgi:hypothetical protein
MVATCIVRFCGAFVWIRAQDMKTIMIVKCVDGRNVFHKNGLKINTDTRQLDKMVQLGWNHEKLLKDE